MEKIVLIGAGNVGTHLGRVLVDSGIEVLQVWSRTLKSAELLAKELRSEPIVDFAQIDSNADAYFFALTDEALVKMLSFFPFENKVLIHTSGSLSMEILREKSNSIGVFYPLQTFSKSKVVDFRKIPILLEASNKSLGNELLTFSKRLSNKVAMANSEQRKCLHIAAVLACNFTNYLYAAAQRILEDRDLDFNLIRPLIRETAEKAMLHFPQDVQTGPAIRKDRTIIHAHLKMLRHQPELQSLYQAMSELIMNERL